MIVAQTTSYLDSDIRLASDKELLYLGYPIGTASFIRQMLACDPNRRPTLRAAQEWWSTPIPLERRIECAVEQVIRLLTYFRLVPCLLLVSIDFQPTGSC